MYLVVNKFNFNNTLYLGNEPFFNLLNINKIKGINKSYLTYINLLFTIKFYQNDL